MTQPSAEVEIDDGIIVTLTNERGVFAWAEAREDLGLNKHGDAVEGVEIVEEDAYYRDEEDEYPAGYNGVTLRFADVDALDAARNRLFSKATERFEWGMDDASDIQDIASSIPTEWDVDEAREVEA